MFKLYPSDNRENSDFWFVQRYSNKQDKTDGSDTEMNRDQKLCYHRIGTPQSEDVIVVEFPEEPLWRM